LFEYEGEAVEPRWVRVNANAVRVENSKHFGGPWLAMKLIERLKLDEFFHKHQPKGRGNVHWSLMSMTLVIARSLDPSSELYLSEQWYPKTAMPEFRRSELTTIACIELSTSFSLIKTLWRSI
jgi:hypothetical protein